MESFETEREKSIVRSTGSGSANLMPVNHLAAESRAVSPTFDSHSGFLSAASSHGGVSLRRFLQILFSHWTRILVVAGFVIFATAAAVIVLPPHYRSEAKLLVRLGRESVVIDPSASIGQSAVPMQGRDKEINSEIELLKSHKLVELVVAQEGARHILSLSGDNNTPRDISKAITLVEDKLNIEAVPDSNILSIQFESRNPDLARDVIARLIDSYLTERSAIYREQGDLKFFASQLAAARDEQADLQQQMQQLRDSSGIADTTQQRAATLVQITHLQELIDEDNASIQSQEAATSSLAAQMGSASAHEQRQVQVANESALKSTIESLRLQKAAAQAALVRVNEVDVKMQKLQQLVTLSAARVTKYAEAFEQTRIDREMGDQHLSNISIAEPPFLPLTPKAPTRSLLVIAGLFLAITLGIGSAFAAEAMDHTLRRAEDLLALGLATVSVPFLGGELRPVALPDQPSDAIQPPTAQVPGNGTDGIISMGDLYQNNVQLRQSLEKLAVRTSTPASGTNGHSVSNGHASAIAVIGAAIRPARPWVISPKLLSHVEGVVERILPCHEDLSAPLVIGVVGPRSGQGASTIAIHLAISLAQRLGAAQYDSENPQRVLLLDADTNSCRSSELAGVAVNGRLAEQTSIISTDEPGSASAPAKNRLDVLTAALLDDKSLFGAQMPQLLQAFGQRYRYLVVDLPPIAENESSARLAASCSAVVLVCKSNQLRIQTARHALGRLREMRAKVAVAVLNQRRYPVPQWIYDRV